MNKNTNLIMFSSVFIDSQIMNHLNNMCKSKNKAMYIPAGMEFYPFDSSMYKRMGFKSADRFSLAYDYDESMIDELLSADMIHIGGGNTFLLKYLLDCRDMMPKLRQFVENGGVLIGNSAGSIVMCQDIQIASIADDNITGKKDYDGLGLVPFEFKPHFQGYQQDIRYFQLYSEVKSKTVYGVDEGSAIIVKRGEIIEAGTPIKIDNGVIR